MTTQQPISKLRIAINFLGLCSVNLIAAVDSTALGVSLPTISSELRATSVQAYWSGTAYVLASAVLQPVFASFSNPFGRKFMILTALTLFVTGSIVCGTAHTISTLLVGRVIQGIGGGGIATLSYVIVADLLPLHKRGNGVAIISVPWLLGTTAGPVVGGGFTTHVSWRWVFWVCLPLAAFSWSLLVFLKTSHEDWLSETIRKRMSRKGSLVHAGDVGQGLTAGQAFRRMDWGGILILMTSLTALLVAVSWGGAMFPWTSTATLLPLTHGAMGLIFFLCYEEYIPAMPVIPTIILKKRTTAIAFICTWLMGIVQFGIVFYMPLYYQVSKGFSPLEAGLAMLPACGLSSISSFLAGRYVAQSRRYRLTLWLGWGLLACGCGILVVLTPTTSTAGWIFLSVPSGMGLGCLFSALAIAAQAPQPKEHQTLAGALSPFLRAIGQAFGIALGDALYQNALKSRLQSVHSSELRQHAASIAENSASMSRILPMIPDSGARNELLHAFNQSLHAVWYALMGVSSLALFLSLFVQQLSLGNNQVVLGAPRPEIESDEAGHKDTGRDIELSSLRSDAGSNNRTPIPERATTAAGGNV